MRQRPQSVLNQEGGRTVWPLRGSSDWSHRRDGQPFCFPLDITADYLPAPTNDLLIHWTRGPANSTFRMALSI